MTSHVVMASQLRYWMKYARLVGSELAQVLFKTMGVIILADHPPKIPYEYEIELQSFRLVYGHYWEIALWANRILVFIVVQAFPYQIAAKPRIKAVIPPSEQLAWASAIGFEFIPVLGAERVEYPGQFAQPEVFFWVFLVAGEWLVRQNAVQYGWHPRGEYRVHL